VRNAGVSTPVAVQVLGTPPLGGSGTDSARAVKGLLRRLCRVNAAFRPEQLLTPFGVAFLLACLLCFSAASAQPLPSSLLPNGDLEAADAADAAKPAAWGKPDGLGVQWVDSGDSSHGRAIRMDTRVTEKAMAAQWRKAGLTNEWNIPKPADNPIAETYGLSLYSDPIPVRREQPYRITFDFKGPSGGAKVWVRGWGMIRGKERRRWEIPVGCNSKGGGWSTCSQVFFPGKFSPEVTRMRVMLFAFYPAGVYWFDNLRLEPITVQEYEAAKR